MRELENYNVAIYCRLSKDDLIHNIESSSISTQKSMITKFVNEHFWFIYDYYIDDGWSGTNFDRPNFQRMMEDINLGNINMVVVKDLSRLGRNYILTGQYTDIIFPDKDVRFIAIDDGIDTLKNNNDITPFKNILNEMYSKDISKKVRSAVRIRKQNGEFLSNFAPYGYKRCPNRINVLIPDENSATIVKEIFAMSASGMGSNTIAKRLNENKLLPPSEYRKALLGKSFNAEKSWTANSVLAILKNRIYTGDMVQGIYECSQFHRTPAKRKPKEEWIITPNTHEPLVERQIWENVQQGITRRYLASGSSVANLFLGLVKCGQCGSALTYAFKKGREIYCCQYYKRWGVKACTGHYIRKAQLQQIVFDEIKTCALGASLKYKYFLSQLNKHYHLHNNIPEKFTNDINTLQQRYNKIDEIIKNLYEDKVNRVITAKRFSILLKEFENEQQFINAEINKIQKNISEIRNKVFNPQKWLKIIAKYKDIKDIEELTREMLTELIEKIVVDEEILEDGNKIINVSIHYNLIGSVDKTILEKLP